MDLRLEKITYLNWHDVADLRVTREQKDFLPDNVTGGIRAGDTAGKPCGSYLIS